MSSEQLAADIRERLGPHNDDALPVVHCVDTLRARVEELEAIRVEAERIVDPDPCWYDHHDHCQAHTLHDRPCPHERLHALLEKEP